MLMNQKQNNRRAAAQHTHFPLHIASHTSYTLV